MRVVLDPGVLIAALLSPHGSPAKLVLAWLAGEFELVVSPKLLAEIGRVLSRPKLRRYVPSEDAERYLELLARNGVFVGDPPLSARLTPDPGDDYLVALARAAGTRYLVSGDRHLTGLRAPEPPVLTPREFLAALER